MNHLGAKVGVQNKDYSRLGTAEEPLEEAHGGSVPTSHAWKLVHDGNLMSRPLGQPAELFCLLTVAVVCLAKLTGFQEDLRQKEEGFHGNERRGQEKTSRGSCV